MIRATLLSLLFCSCVDGIEQRRADRDLAYREEKLSFYRSTCMKECKTDFDWCISRKGHSSGACSEHYNDCARDCEPR
jgi:hypothetical protein